MNDFLSVRTFAMTKTPQVYTPGQILHSVLQDAIGDNLIDLNDPLIKDIEGIVTRYEQAIVDGIEWSLSARTQYEDLPKTLIKILGTTKKDTNERRWAEIAIRRARFGLDLEKIRSKNRPAWMRPGAIRKATPSMRLTS